ncbi:MAG: sulfatase-like hydrolase/transferase, partial [Planctomycetales bacterium]|nr:sulfatase-like hydrolase/transferase [Planctomycetales bacterium]NIP70263.1 sulfatase-like hydrolase/transferase [Planctomycetales bacterium]
MTSKPNVLFLMSDQHNPHVAGLAGDRLARTQNLDRLAAESVQFDAAYCQVPLCTPSRISMWTGRLAHRRSGWANNVPIPPEFLTIPEHFAKHGYTTCGVGKMHVSGERPMNGFQFRPYGDLRCNRFCGHQPDPLKTAVDNAWT